ncbi:MAG: phosphatidate cytidylyltransferase [Novosphingobium sp.]
MAGGEPAKKSDLGVRTLSAIVMVGVAGAALWLGGSAWIVFVGLVAAGVLWEWRRLVDGFGASIMQRMAWNVGGIMYIGFAAAMLLALRGPQFPLTPILAIVLAVVATDIGAYFAGRTIGGSKIAPKISPSKTWAGLGGGIVGATLAIAAVTALAAHLQPDSAGGPVFSGADSREAWRQAPTFGFFIAIIAQAGDFFESWMKRRAGVKDSSQLIPGHGGLFDRVDGLLAVLFVGGMLTAGTVLLGLG